MKDDTLIVHSGRDPENNHGVVNPPVYHASTIIFPTMEAHSKRKEGAKKYRGVYYGAFGTPTTFALTDAACQLEEGQGAVVVSTGQAACNLAIMALVDQGNHILVTDSTYGPTRHFCDTVLKRFGVETTYYDPLIGSNISGLFRPNTRLVFAESPGTMTFEMQDIPAICEAAHSQNVLVLMDNTWATPLFFKPIKFDVDVSIQAGTKYISGHSDLVIGIITARTEELFQKIKDTTMAIGDIAAPDDCYLALRGLRTMGVRLRQHQSSAYKIADWFNKRPEVKRVLYPPLESDPGHFIWKRDFKGACGLFGVVLHPFPSAAVARMLDNYDLFKIGASWGGFESLVLPCYPAAIRTVNAWNEKGFLLRYHIGLEDPDDLIADLEEGFVRLNKTYTEGEEDL